MAEIIDDFSPLRELPAFQELYWKCSRSSSPTDGSVIISISGGDGKSNPTRATLTARVDAARSGCGGGFVSSQSADWRALYHCAFVGPAEKRTVGLSLTPVWRGRRDHHFVVLGSSPPKVQAAGRSAGSGETPEVGG